MIRLDVNPRQGIPVAVSEIRDSLDIRDRVPVSGPGNCSHRPRIESPKTPDRIREDENLRVQLTLECRFAVAYFSVQLAIVYVAEHRVRNRMAAEFDPPMSHLSDLVPREVHSIRNVRLQSNP